MPGDSTLSNALILSVSDTGQGIAPDKRDRIFDPFYTTRKAGKGTGLGLSISYGIIRNHEGDIQVVSEPGKGTRFKIAFPIQAGSAEGKVFA